MSRAKQIDEITEKITDLMARIKELDLWFIANLSAADWTEKMNEYWNAQARVEELREQRNRLRVGKHRLIKQHKTYSIPNPTTNTQL